MINLLIVFLFVFMTFTAFLLLLISEKISLLIEKLSEKEKRLSEKE